MGSNLVSSEIQDGNGVKATLGLIPASNSASFKKVRKIDKWALEKKHLRRLGI